MDPISTTGSGVSPLVQATTGFAGPYSTTPTSPISTGQTPGKDQFLQLLVTQLRHQDPLNPMQDREFITQLAQFNALEEMQKLNQSFDSMLAAQDVQIGTALMGKTVEYQDMDGTTQSGTVSQVQWHSGIVKLTIGQKEVTLLQITSVR